MQLARLFMTRSLHGVLDWLSNSTFVPPTRVSLDDERVHPGSLHEEREALLNCVLDMLSLHTTRALLDKTGSLFGVW